MSSLEVTSISSRSRVGTRNASCTCTMGISLAKAPGLRALGWTVAALVAACARRGPDLEQPVGITMVRGASLERTEPRPPVATQSDAGHSEVGLQVPGCGEALPSFLFSSGSAVVSPSDDHALGAVAACMRTRAGRSAAIIVVGHGDAVGSELENVRLGLERASKIRAFLIALGVPAERVIATSSGERSTEATRPGRRVDLFLASPPRRQ
jgi:outer membrane protein OmpA-like peptidoglycan-associated protein